MYNIRDPNIKIYLGLKSQIKKPKIFRIYIMSEFTGERFKPKNTEELQNAITIYVKNKSSWIKGPINTWDVSDIEDEIKRCLSDDLNTPQAIAQLFELARRVYLVNDGKETVNSETKKKIEEIFNIYFRGILGIQESAVNQSSHLNDVMNVLIELRVQAKADKNFALSDAIRDKLKTSGIEIMDSKEGSSWKIV